MHVQQEPRQAQIREKPELPRLKSICIRVYKADLESRPAAQSAAMCPSRTAPCRCHRHARQCSSVQYLKNQSFVNLTFSCQKKRPDFLPDVFVLEGVISHKQLGRKKDDLRWDLHQLASAGRHTLFTFVCIVHLLQSHTGVHARFYWIRLLLHFCSLPHSCSVAKALLTEGSHATPANLPALYAR